MKPFRLIHSCGFILLCLTGCDLFQHLQHMDAPSVVLSDPADQLVKAEDLPVVSLTFSSEMNRIETEQAFSLTEGGKVLVGDFSWEGSTLKFSPCNRINDNKEYLLTVLKDAEDEWGNSLERDWFYSFSTRSEQVPPELIAACPEDFSLLEGLRTPLTLTFSEPVDQESFRKSLHLSPDFIRTFSWDEASMSVTLIPLEDYQAGQDFTLEISEELLDLSGNCLKEEISLLYRIRDEIPPAVLRLFLAESGTELILREQGVNRGLEKDCVIHGDLNRSLNPVERSTLICLLPDQDFQLEWKEDNMEFDLTFPEYLTYGEIYDLNILDQTYLLQSDGEGSRPVSVERVIFCPHAVEVPPVLKELSLNSSLQAEASDDVFFDFYMGHAAGTSLDVSSFINAISLDTPVLSWDFLSLEVYDHTQLPDPDILPAENESLFRIRLGITDTGAAGTVVLSLDDSLRDSRDNHLEGGWALTVIQP